MSIIIYLIITGIKSPMRDNRGGLGFSQEWNAFHLYDLLCFAAGYQQHLAFELTALKNRKRCDGFCSSFLLFARLLCFSSKKENWIWIKAHRCEMIMMAKEYPLLAPWHWFMFLFMVNEQLLCHPPKVKRRMKTCHQFQQVWWEWLGRVYFSSIK